MSTFKEELGKGRSGNKALTLGIIRRTQMRISGTRSRNKRQQGDWLDCCHSKEVQDMVKWAGKEDDLYVFC